MATPEDRAFGPKGVEDMITLDNLTEETMLKNLQHRYNKGLIYVTQISHLIYSHLRSNSSILDRLSRDQF